MNQDIIGILLAAGQSARFGANKLVQALPNNSLSMIEQSAQTLLSVLPNSIAVIRRDDDAVKDKLESIGMAWIENPQADSGISSSMRCGMNYLREQGHQVGGWLFALADMPYISSSVVEQVVAALSQAALISAPYYREQRGHPVGFSRQLESELLALEGDVGAKNIIQRYEEYVRRIPVLDDGVVYDVDRPQQLKALSSAHL